MFDNNLVFELQSTSSRCRLQGLSMRTKDMLRHGALRERERREIEREREIVQL